MKIYRIYYEIINYNENDIEECEEITVKYVDDIKKYDEFLKKIDDYNKNLPNCYNCPIIHLTKRKYNNKEELYSEFKCNEKNIYYEGNTLICEGFKKYKPDYNTYLYEEINVE